VELIADWIAGNKLLQAVAIVVAVGTLVIFVYKNAPPAIQFLYDAIRNGRWRAFAKRCVLRIGFGFFVFAPVAIFLVVAIIKDQAFHLEAPGLKDVLATVVILPVSFAFASYLTRPISELISYLFWSRRFVIRRIRAEAASSSQ
jgi:hypothetical protein